MKKVNSLLAFVMAFCACVGASACELPDFSNSTSQPSGSYDSSVVIGGVVIDEEKWESLLDMSNFYNVTCSFSVLFEGETEAGEFMFMLDGNAAKMVEEGEEYMMDEEEVASLRNVYISTILMVLNNYSDFSYDQASGYYVNNNTVTYNVDMMGMDAEIIATNVKAKIDEENNNVMEVSCHMVQNYVEDGKPDSLTLDVVFNFYDHGTTVVEA